MLMEILKQRMTNHKAKFISPIIYQELCTLEVKKNGRIEHASNAHDDQIFSMLMALYVWYEGKDLMEHFGLEKSVLYSDDDDTIETQLNESYVNIVNDINVESDSEIEEALNFIKDGSKYVQYNDFQRQYQDDYQKDLMMKVSMDPKMKRAYSEKYHVDISELGDQGSLVELPQSVFLGTFSSTGDRLDKGSELQRKFNDITNLR